MDYSTKKIWDNIPPTHHQNTPLSLHLNGRGFLKTKTNKMQYKNFEKVIEICNKIKEHEDKVNSLNEKRHSINVTDTFGRIIEQIKLQDLQSYRLSDFSRELMSYHYKEIEILQNELSEL